MCGEMHRAHPTEYLTYPGFLDSGHPSKSSAWGAHTKRRFCRASGPHSSPGAQRPPSELLADPVGGGSLPLRAEPSPWGTPREEGGTVQD